MGIYVEIQIAGEMDELWAKTQTPEIHQQWDLRFSEISYLPRQADEPQRFLYATRIGAGMKISGGGESTGQHDSATGERTSALKFWSDDAKALIRTGSGYWKYVPNGNAVTFLTWYDYEARWGVLGKLIDRVFFRPLIGWATAWSFDRLRLWIERGITPQASLAAASAYVICRLAVVFVWLYQGLVPKILFENYDEMYLMFSMGIHQNVPTYVHVAGWLEVLMGVLTLLLWRGRWQLWVTIGAMMVALGSVLLRSPLYAASAFNVVTLNACVAALCICALVLRSYTPTAGYCLRKPRTVK